MVTAREHPKGSREGQPLVWGGQGWGWGRPSQNSQEGRFHVPGASLTLGLQLGQDGLGPTDGSRCEGLDAFLRRVADCLDVGVALLGGGVGCRHHVAGGADEGHVGHAVHHAGLRENSRGGPGRAWRGGGAGPETQAPALSPSLTHGQGNSSAHPGG